MKTYSGRSVDYTANHTLQQSCSSSVIPIISPITTPVQIEMEVSGDLSGDVQGFPDHRSRNERHGIVLFYTKFQIIGPSSNFQIFPIDFNQSHLSGVAKKSRRGFIIPISVKDRTSKND
ncbi:hypothetical protein TcasGA2_TC012265 [Tribolium castaneum]|uniref:Uncharacterized protein n=1 Tax=Tribolium castaneum TaxID=7070 RepID=D6X089_TRICA|nr:hypothetical protein TcasGA2_TC012265 [Tribolium castaneum]